MFKQCLHLIMLLVLMIALENLDIFTRFGNVAYANEAGANVVGSGKASHASCSFIVGPEKIIGIIAGIGTGIGAIYAAYILLAAPDPSGISKGIALLGLASAATGMGILIKNSMSFFACAFSFVRHPVLRWEDTGKYKKCSNPEKLYPKAGESRSCSMTEKNCVCKTKEYEDENGYKWPENKAPYSDFIELCYRFPMAIFPASLAYVGMDGSGFDNREWDFGKDGDFAESTSKETKKSDQVVEMKMWTGGPLVCKTLKVGDKETIHTITFEAYYDGGKICAKAVGNLGNEAWLVPAPIGCHARKPTPPAPLCDKSVPILNKQGNVYKYDNSKCYNCYISSACYSQVSTAVKAPTPMTSVIIQCIRESLDNLLNGKCTVTSGQTSSGKGFLASAQDKLKGAVTAVLTLAVILFGIKMMMGHAIQGPHEYFILLLKFAFVIYFAIGDGMSIYYKSLVDLSVGLSDIILSAGGNDQICNYKTSDYIKAVTVGGKSVVQDHSYLAPWDRLDCRIFFYLGSGFAPGAIAASTAAVAAAVFTPLFIVPLMVVTAMLAGQILIAICVAFFTMMLILTVIWMVHLFILSLIALTLVSLFAPLFVPMILFQATKGFFDGWLKQLVAFSMYPIILFAFIALLFSVFDKLYFEDLKFKSVFKDQKVDGRVVRKMESFVLDDAKQCQDKKEIIACVVSNIKFATSSLILNINVTKLDISQAEAENIWKGFGMMGLMAFLFYYFLGIISGMAAELSGSFRADLSHGTTGPKAMAAKIQAAGIATSKLIGGARKTAFNAAKNKAGGDGKEEVGSTKRGSPGGK